MKSSAVTRKTCRSSSVEKIVSTDCVELGVHRRIERHEEACAQYQKVVTSCREVIKRGKQGKREHSERKWRPSSRHGTTIHEKTRLFKQEGTPYQARRFIGSDQASNHKTYGAPTHLPTPAGLRACCRRGACISRKLAARVHAYHGDGRKRGNVAGSTYGSKRVTRFLPAAFPTTACLCAPLGEGPANTPVARKTNARANF